MNNSIINYIWVAVQVIIGYNLVMPLVLFFFYKIRNYKTRPITRKSDYEADYAIIVTAFEQTDLLPSVVSSILKLNYNRYLVYVVADKCDISNLHFDDERIILLRPEETLASNTRSHFYAISRFKRGHELLTIIDSDNLVHPDYLSELNVFFEQGFLGVQGVRKAKNLNTTYACLDAARDIYYHYYDGKILFRLGSSATLAGSGMAFTTKLYQDCLGHLNIDRAGFDKVLQFSIVNRDLKIAYAHRAIVYDEKTTASSDLVKQRSRWIYTWLKYSRYGFILLGKGIKRFNLNQFLFGIVLLRPPLFITVILSLICMSINILTGSMITAILWVLALFSFVLAFIIALLRPQTDPKIYFSLIRIPKFMFYQVVALLKIRSNKKSIASRHTYHSFIDEIVRRDKSFK